MCINTSVSNLDTHESALKKDSWIWIYSPFFVHLIKNYAICCSRQILMTARVLNVSVAIFGLPNTIFICSIRKLTGIFHLSCVGARVKTGLFTYGRPHRNTPYTKIRSKKYPLIEEKAKALAWQQDSVSTKENERRLGCSQRSIQKLNRRENV